jgi:hypothetical protein
MGMKIIISIFILILQPIAFAQDKSELHWTQKIFIKENKLDKNIEVTAKPDLVNKKINEFKDPLKNLNEENKITK